MIKEKWQKFKKQKRAIRSFKIFTAMFFVTLFAEFIANDKPILIYYDGGFYTPVFKAYSETEFGGDFPTEADYKDPFVQNLIKQKGWMIMPVIEYSYDTINYETANPSPPTFENLLGTDDQGRDVLARIIYGFRISVIFGILLTFFSSIIGVIAGSLQGYLGGKFDLFFQRFLEIWGSMPQLFILILISSLITPSFFTLLLILLVFSWTSLVGVVRAEFLKVRNMDYVKAAKALGASNKRIIFKHILPNALTAAVTFIPFNLSGAITSLTALDFLGLGLPVGSPSLGELLKQGKENLNSPWIAVSVFVTLALLLVLLIFIGEGIRKVYNTKNVVSKKDEEADEEIGEELMELSVEK